MLLHPYNTTEMLPEAGLDEAGRGALAGPLIAAAVIFPARPFELPGLNDSKQLSPAERARLAPLIKAQAIAWAIGEVTPQEVDHHNVRQASFIAMHRALDLLIAKGSTPRHLLIDGPSFVDHHLIPYTCIVKGDSRLMAIAAASILAKTYRDACMAALCQAFPRYAWEKNKGYPTRLHRLALQKYGPTPHHRTTFRYTAP